VCHTLRARVSAIPVLFIRVLIGRFHKPPLLPCLDRIAQPYTLCTNKDIDAANSRCRNT
jgi:hypothetical protein